jgi:hypothetical protein
MLFLCYNFLLPNHLLGLCHPVVTCSAVDPPKDAVIVVDSDCNGPSVFLIIMLANGPSVGTIHYTIGRHHHKCRGLEDVSVDARLCHIPTTLDCAGCKQVRATARMSDWSKRPIFMGLIVKAKEWPPVRDPIIAGAPWVALDVPGYLGRLQSLPG